MRLGVLDCRTPSNCPPTLFHHYKSHRAESPNDPLEGGPFLPSNPPTKSEIHPRLGNTLCFPHAHLIHESEELPRQKFRPILANITITLNPRYTVLRRRMIDKARILPRSPFTSEDSLEACEVIARRPQITSPFTHLRSLPRLISGTTAQFWRAIFENARLGGIPLYTNS